jgi:hypothetical protein
LIPGSSRPERPSVLRVRADCGSRLFKAKLGVFGITPGRMKRWRDRHRAHTLPRDPVSACLPPTPLHRCIGLRVRSLNDPRDARLRPFNRHTLEPAAASGANRRIRHHPPANSDSCSNGLAPSELRRIFCSDEGSWMHPSSFLRETTPGLSSMGVGSLSAPAGAPAHYRGASVQYADVNGFSATGS